MKILLLVFILLCSAQLRATEENKEGMVDIFSLSLRELMNLKVTGSTLTPKKLATVPAAVTVFSFEQIKRMGLDTLDELINLVPGFQSYRSSASSLNHRHSVRGRSIGASGADVLVLVDGQRLNDPRTGGSFIIVQKFPLMYIERVEFIRGPGAAIYGSNAMMGVINIVTRSNANEIGVSYGSFNRRQAYVLASSQWGNVEVEVLAHIETDDGDDYHTPDGFDTSNYIDTTDPRELSNLNVKIHWQKIHVHLQHYRSEVEDFYVTNHLSNNFNQRRARFSSMSLEYDFDWQSIVSSFRLDYMLTNVRSYGQLTAPGALTAISNPSSSNPLFASPGFDDHSEVGALWHNDLAIDVLSNVQFGLELRHIDSPEAIAKSNFNIGDLANRNFPVRYYGSLIDNTSVQAESRRDIIGIYGQYQRKLLERTQLTLGLRYDSFSSIGDQLSPRVGLVQELTDHHNLKLLYGEAFRAPSENELNLLNNPVFLGNPDLEPETVQSFDLLWVAHWSHTGFSLGYFESHFENAIVQTSINNGPLQFENVSQDPTKGFEFELAHEPNEHWLLRGTYTDITEKPELSFREAEQFASLMVNYQQGNWNANLIATWHNERELPAVDSFGSRIILDDYWQVHGKLKYSFNPDMQVFIQAKNLLDEGFLTPAASTNLTLGVPNRGREILAGIVWQF